VRILRLELQKFGPFTGQSLDFEAGPFGLHVIFGPNEAGKSSTLRALVQLLYGIPHNSSDNFLHPNQELRIGAVMEDSSGRRLECVRRKGRSKTLRGAGDAGAIEPQLLADMLGGIDDATFRQRFGIDYEELRSGGERVVRGGGDLGEILFAAGSGMADLGRVQKRLADEADELFKPRGSVQRINKAVSELNNARRAIKEAQLPSAEWAKHDKALRQANARKAELDGQLLEQESEKGRLQRIRDALPVIGRRQQLLDELQPLAGTPLLPDDFAEQRRKLVTQLELAQMGADEAESAIESLSRQMDELDVPESLLEHAGAIQQLKEELGSYRKAAGDRGGLAAQAQQVEKDALEILRDLGRDEQLSEADNLRVTRVERQRIQELGNQRSALVNALDTAKHDVSDLQRKLAGAHEQLATLSEPRDTTELDRAVRQAQQQADLPSRLEKLRGELKLAQQQAEIDLNKLPLWSGSLADLESLSVPSPETIDRFETEIDSAKTEHTQLQQRHDELSQDLADIDQQVEALRLEQDVPSEADLHAAREHRDEGWQLIRQMLDAGDAADGEVRQFIEQFAPDRDLAAAFEESVRQADQLADRLRREAEQVATKAKLLAEREKLHERLAAAASTIESAASRLAENNQRWQQLWQPLGIDPLSPREMRRWVQQQSALATAAASIRKLQSETGDLRDKVDSLCEDLSRCLKNLGENTEGNDTSLDRLLDRAQQVVAQCQAVGDQRRELDREISRLNADRETAQLAVSDAEHRLDTWKTDWAAATKALQLEDDATPNDANSVLDAIRELREKVGEAEQLRERIAGIDRDAQRFGESTARVTGRAAADLAKLPADQAAADLHDRLIAAQRSEAKLADLHERLEHETAKRDEARLQIESRTASIDAMCREAGCQSAYQLPDAERRSAQRRAGERELRQVEDQLLRLAAGSTLDEFITAARQVDADQLEPMLRQLTDDVQLLSNELSEVLKTIGSEQTELRRMDGSGRAADAREQAEYLLARTRADAEQYVRLRLASAVLQRSVERFREKNQGPVLGRASDLFSELTLASFDGLRADYNDKGEPVLVGVRPDGQSVGVDGMSDGTCDQLYLALRLASLDTYLEDREPLPFIIDDILIMFDDDRAVAALKTLAHLSERTQVIFFTHHEHLLDLAGEYIDEETLHIHRLGAQSLSTTARSS